MTPHPAEARSGPEAWGRNIMISYPLDLKIAGGSLEAAHQNTLAAMLSGQFPSRLFGRDATLFGGDAKREQIVASRLGWLALPEWLETHAGELRAFAEQVKADGLQHVVLLGMGGSSLCPEVLSLVVDLPSWLKSFHVLDATDPDTIQRIEDAIQLEQTLFIVSSKSGSTTETRSQADYFYGLFAGRVADAGRHFVAITDPGSSLQTWAESARFRHVFLNPEDIGGRYSALSYFGMVPGALLGLPLDSVAANARTAASALARNDIANPGLALGVLMGEGAKSGRDKLTFVTSRRAAPLIPWIEQLIAESTGKEGTGIVPIEGEPVGALSDYGPDRLFVFVTMGDERIDTPLLIGIGNSDVPHAALHVSGPDDLGSFFLLWECAVSAAGHVLGINPFDEPNVQESKDNTKRLLQAYDAQGHFAAEHTLQGAGPVLITAPDASDMQPRDLVVRFLHDVGPGEYLAFLYFGDRVQSAEDWLYDLRRKTRERFKVATLRGFGPRFLHSIGQLYKGGRQNGRFVVITHKPGGDRRIPDAKHTFATLLLAQAIGDYEALARRDRPVLRAHLQADLESAQRAFTNLWKTALDSLN